MLVCAVRVLTVIPARIGSTRLPEKPLRTIRGDPLARLVARNILEHGIGDEVVVASDDRRVLDAVRPLGVRGIMTSPSHRSGTERVAEVLRLPEYARAEVILNVQGDQPFLPPEATRGALHQVEIGFEIGTAAASLSPSLEFVDSVVAVTIDRNHRARSFSRGPVDQLNDADLLHHLGVYAYAPESVLKWVSLPECDEEFTEGLEQLRPLRHGMSNGVEVIAGAAPLAVDTPSDLWRARAIVNQISGQSRKSA